MTENIESHNDIYDALVAILHKLTVGGGIHGNPYCVPEVKSALETLGEFQGCDWADVVLVDKRVGVK